ncbi:MAG: type I polyketide synthase, partial [Chromatiales bacterium]|nr:type I polyketide synthase [Chromatiales bacterium]
DPQQRFLLEMAWEAIEGGGQRPGALAGSNCGVYIGISATDYGNRNIEDPAAGDAYTMSGNTLSTAANRLSYFLDLRGPSMAIDTACSSSLVAIHQACQAIWCQETDYALAGGMHLLLNPLPFIGFSAASMLSRTGRSRSFDAAADGYVRGEGGGLVFLKPLDAAVADGDPILASIVATGVNTSGHTSAMAVPSHTAQEALISAVYARAGIAGESLRYVEAHGTGTPVGDPLEARAIGDAVGPIRAGLDALPIGSVKSNLGHLEPAAGVAGLLKVVAQLQNRALAPTLHQRTPNPMIDFDALNLRVVTELEELQSGGRPLVMGVNATGFGGANAHVVLREAPPVEPRPKQTAGLRAPLLLSAHSEPALRDLAASFAEHLEHNATSAEDRYDVAWTCALRRDRHEHRVVVDTVQGQHAQTALRAFAAGKRNPAWVSGSAVAPRRAAFLFSGNGAQWTGMGHQLLADSATFRQVVEDIQLALPPNTDLDLAHELGDGADPARMRLTEVAQPTLFAVQAGLVTLLRERGLVADMALGHSVGEVAAAWTVGALTLRQATQVIVERSRAQALTRGAGRMAALALDEHSARRFASQLSETLEIAAVNSPSSVTVAGPEVAIAALDKAARVAGHRCLVLDLDYAFHSRAMDPIRDGLRNALASLAPQAVGSKFISTVEESMTGAARPDAEYWWRNVRCPVQLDRSIDVAMARGASMFVEIGPRPVLSGYIAENLRQKGHDGVHVATLTRTASDSSAVRNAASQAFCQGYEPQMDKLFPVPGRVAPLPNYPWQRERFWYRETAESARLIHAEVTHPLLGFAIVKDEPIWERQIDLDLLPWLADHRVQGMPVFPGAAYVELALAACRALGESPSLEVQDLSILAPMIFRDAETRTVRVNVDPEDGRLTIRSRRRLSDDRWTLHAQARVLIADTSGLGGSMQSNSPLTGALAEEVNRAQHYKRAHAVGLDYGPAFQTVQAVRATPGHIEADLAANVDWVDHFQDYCLSPPLLDGAIQTLLHAAGMGAAHADHTFVPVSMQRIATRRSGGHPVQCRVRVTSYTPRTLLADIELLASDGTLLAFVEGCRLRAAGAVMRAPAELPPLYRMVRRLTNVAEACERERRLSHESLALAVHERFKTANRSPARRRFHEEFAPLLEALGLALGLDKVMHLTNGQREFDLNALYVSRGIAESGQALLERLLDILARHGMTEHHERSGHYRLKFEDEFNDVSAIWRICATEFPEYVAELTALPAAAEHVRAQMESGTAEADRHGAPETRHELDPVLATSASAKVARQGALSVVTAVQAEWPPNQRLKILDCGGNAGWLGLPQAKDKQPMMLHWAVGAAQAEFTDAGRMQALEQHLPFIPLPNLDLDVTDRFDLITLSCSPLNETASGEAISSLARLLSPGGLMVLYGQCL